MAGNARQIRSAMTETTNDYLLRGYEEATAWLEHAASLVCSPSSQEKGDMVAVLEDCSHALQCVNTLSTIETSQVRLHALSQLSGLLERQLRKLQATQPVGAESIPTSAGGETDSECQEVPSVQDQHAKSRQAAILDTIMQKSTLTFNNVAGLTEAKQVLREAIVLPLQYPHLFTGARQPWRRILLYGPPGTGKTRLAQALSGEIGSNFYCVSSSDLLSSWVGESEKIIKELFRHARRSSGTSVVFIDEVDCVCRQRSSSEEEHTRRIKTELLRQMEGADTSADSGGEGGGRMFLLCATNCPWELDGAFIRRFQKRIYVPLPPREVRLSMLQLHLASVPTALSDVEWALLASKTEGYSGSDIATFCSDAAMMPVRELEGATHWKVLTGGQHYTPCSPTDPEGKLVKFADIPPNQVRTRKVTLEDCLKMLQRNHMTVTGEDLKKYREFTERCGQEA